jgi:hypothetical protein
MPAMRTLFIAIVLSAACGGSSNGGGDAGATSCPSTDMTGGSVLVLQSGQPKSCPCYFPANATSCAPAMIGVTCEYTYPAGTHPSGCGATCVANDMDAASWIAPGCI